MPSSPTPRDNPDAHRFEIDTDAGLAVAVYEIDGGVITFTHTEVPEAARGQGVSTRLVEAALASARARDLKVVPQCPTFAVYMQKHPETDDLLAPEAGSHRR